MREKLKVTVFLPSYSEKQRTILQAFAQGVPQARVRELSDPYKPCDVAVIFGLYKKSYSPTWEKRKVLEKHSGSSLIVIDSSYVNRGEYYNIGFGGINGNADFKTGGVNRDRWLGLGIREKPWHTKVSGPVVVCGQVPWDTAVQDTDHTGWCHETLSYYVDKGVPVLFRPHPRIPDWRSRYGNIPEHLVDQRKLPMVLEEARCFVTYNSNAAVDAAIAGVPVIAVDKGSGAYPVSMHEVSDYHNPWYCDRRDWLAGIGYSQWTLDEMQQGLPWRHLTRDL